MTQLDLAHLMGMRPESVQRWEAGTQTPRKRVRKKIAKRLGVTVEDLGFVVPGPEAP